MTLWRIVVSNGVLSEGATFTVALSMIGCAPQVQRSLTSMSLELLAAAAIAGASTPVDVEHYRIAVTVDTTSGRLKGRAALTAVAGPTVRLDLALTPDTVTVNRRPAVFTHDGLALRFANPTPGPVRIIVSYHGVPERTWVNGQNPWMSTATEQVAAGEPRIAPWWFPAHDVPGDKATYDIIGRVGQGQQFISNGRLVSRAQGRWHWRSTAPMASYVTLMAAGSYRGADGWTYASSAALPMHNLRLLQRTPKYLRWLATQFGPYPFAEHGGLVTATFANENWSMETQTRPTYPDLIRLAEVPELMVHELAHQWFGNSVTPATWSDIWLNEGFARWAEVRWQEDQGLGSARTWLNRQHSRHREAFWRVPIGDPPPEDLLSAAVYERGAMTVQALRQRLGDEVFFALLPAWTSRYRHATATVDDFIMFAEQVSGQDLRSFFQAWLFTPTRPRATAANGL